MRKVHIDNVGEYYEKKQQRLKKNRGQIQPQQQQLRSTECSNDAADGSPDSDSSDAKRSKTE